jgi:Gluconate 2-dehydrogenase subunit 3
MARDFTQAVHLPNLRPDRQPPSPDDLPRQRNGVTPQMHGRYPDYNVLDEAGHWDEVTRQVVIERVEQVPPIRFFTTPQAHTLSVFCDCVMAQDREPRIPVLNFIDEKLHDGKLDGFQHADMPDDREVWHTVARVLGEHRFAEMSVDDQHDLCQQFADGKLELPFNQTTAWSVVMRYVLQAFYSHPWSWNEIGFGGPAYPRGYTRLATGMREAWEGTEEWQQDPVRDTQERGLE